MRTLAGSAGHHRVGGAEVELQREARRHDAFDCGGRSGGLPAARAITKSTAFGEDFADASSVSVTWTEGPAAAGAEVCAAADCDPPDLPGPDDWPVLLRAACSSFALHPREDIVELRLLIRMLSRRFVDQFLRIFSLPRCMSPRQGDVSIDQFRIGFDRVLQHLHGAIALSHRDAHQWPDTSARGIVR